MTNKDQYIQSIRKHYTHDQLTEMLAQARLDFAKCEKFFEQNKGINTTKGIGLTWFVNRENAHARIKNFEMALSNE